MHKKLLSVVFIWLCVLSSMADTLRIVEPFRVIEHASVLASYRNEFGSYRKPNMDVEFPYALIRVHIEGDELAVTKAKERFALYLGQHYTTKAKNTNHVNEIMFLVPVGAGHAELQCGDGCQPLVLFDNPRLTADAIYEGKVRYALEIKKRWEEPDPITKQYFKFRIHPADVAGITVLVTENGQQEPWNVADGIASRKLDYGVYHYVISADRYHKTEGTFTVSDTGNELDIHLRPQFGWLNVSGDNSAQGAYVFATNHSTGDVKQIGTIPLQNTELNAGAYSLRIQKTKYKDYLTTISIKEGETTTIRPVLEANFAQLTLAVQSGAEIWLEGNQLGTTSWTGTLELGEYTIEARQANHRSSYTQVVVSEQSVGKTIQLNNPKPIYGTFEVSGSPADATVYVDGKKMGTTPLLVNKILIGSHKVRIEKDGYDKQEKTVTITEGQEAVLDYTLTKTVVKEPIMATTAQGSAMETITVNGVSFNMIKVEGGTFAMGATSEIGNYAYSNEIPVHTVTLSDYYIGETEVTQELWQAVMGTTIQDQAKKGTFETWLHDVGNNYPMYYINWYDCQTFIKKLNQLTGKKFRLPTEAEWEFAARGGNKSHGYEYAGSDTAYYDVAWYGANSDETPHPVKQKQANELGLYDMSGNVNEWCQDWYGPYTSNAQVNPLGPPTGTERVVRGGDFFTDHIHSCRVSNRTYQEPSTTMFEGMRLVLDLNKSVVAQVEQPLFDTQNTHGNSPQRISVKGVSFDMIKVEGGTFTMGATSEQGSNTGSEEKPAHKVTLSDYYIAETEVTQALWQAVMGTNPSYFKGSNLPVEQVSWDECQAFITKLNQMTGKNFRLPTEAEWEYAARGGNKSKGYKYAGSNTLSDVAWYNITSDNTHPVMQKLANELGLFDMSGNVWEWCQDWYGKYSNTAQNNPTGPASGSYRVIRGGSWDRSAERSCVWYSGRNLPTNNSSNIGLRLAL